MATKIMTRESGYVHRAPLKTDDCVKGVEGRVEFVRLKAHTKGKREERWKGENIWVKT